MDAVSIVIPAFNQLEYCRACIASIIEQTRREYRLILVDNGSTDGVGEFFDSIPGAVVVHAEQNRGFAGGVNLGLGQAEGHVVVLNSDTLVSPGWLARLEAALLSAGDIGMAGPRTNNAPGPQQVPRLALRNQEEINAFAEKLAHDHAGRVREAVREAVRLVGFCMLIREEALRDVGRFDESYGIGNYEDDDYCWRLREAGYRMVIADDAFVYHHGGRTFAGMGYDDESFRELLETNRARFLGKWGYGLPGNATPRQKAEVLHARAQEALAHKRPKEAAELASEAVRLDPENGDHYALLASVMEHAGRQDMAFRLMKQAVARAPEDGLQRRNLLVLAESMGQRADAERYLRSLGEDSGSSST
jgi:GT2 family glycosyltransferase